MRTLKIYFQQLSYKTFCCSVAKSCPTLQPHELQTARLPCPSLSPSVCSNSHPLSQRLPSNHLILCHPLLLLPSIFPNIRVFSQYAAVLITLTYLWLGVCFLWPPSSCSSSCHPPFGNHNSDLSLFFKEFACFWSIIDLQLPSSY